MPGSNLAYLTDAAFTFESAAALPSFKSRTGDEHLDNVEIAWMLDQQRMEFARHVGWWSYLTGGLLGMLVSTQIDYLHELWADRPILIGAAIGDVGSSSYSIVQAVRQSDQVVAVARTVLVLVGPNGAQKIASDMRSLMEGAKLGVPEPCA
ncbi:MAG: acyl-CoA thioesterase [Sphingobium sp.]